MVDLSVARVLAGSGLLRPVRPDRLAGMALALARWGVSPAAGYAAGAARHPHRVALIDDVGALTWQQVDRRTDRMAGHLRALGLQPGEAAGLLARNGRGFVESAVALAKCGADVLYLNTGLAPAQLAAVLDREAARAVVYDGELAGLLEPGDRVALSTEELGEQADRPGPGAPQRAEHVSRQVILTSGTTGPPRGAARSGAGPLDALAMLSAIPLRSQETTVLAAPAFHAWGLGQLSLSLVLGSTVVLRRRFDPQRVLADIAEHRASALVVVPVMLDQLLAADRRGRDLSSLRVIATSGAALPGDLVQRTEAAFGPVLYNLYGSTEVAYAAVAGPEDLRHDPGTAGRPPLGVRLRVVDEEGHDVPPGEPGRIFAGSRLSFAGYTDGSDRERLQGLVATGDRGRLGADGRLTVLGRDDDLVVVGGENVHLGPVEDCLRSHPAVADAAVVGLPDPAYGSRLCAHVVLRRPVPEAELQAWVRDRLARFAVPREVRVHEQLPRNATGKVVKQELVAR